MSRFRDILLLRRLDRELSRASSRRNLSYAELLENVEIPTNGDLNLDDVTSVALENAMHDALNSNHKIKIFIDFSAIYFKEVAEFYLAHKDIPLCSHWITKIINLELINFLAYLYGKHGQENIAIEILYDRSADPEVNDSGHDRHDAFLLNLFFETLRSKNSSIQLTAVTTHCLRDWQCHTIQAKTSDSPSHVSLYSPLIASTREQTERAKTIQNTRRAFLTRYPKNAYLNEWTTDLSPARLLTYFVAKDKAQGECFFHLYFNDNKIAIPATDKEKLPVWVIGVGAQPLIYTASYIPPSGMVDRGFAARDRQTRRANAMTTGKSIEEPSLAIYREAILRENRLRELGPASYALSKKMKLGGVLQDGVFICVGNPLFGPRNPNITLEEIQFIDLHWLNQLTLVTPFSSGDLHEPFARESLPLYFPSGSSGLIARSGQAGAVAVEAAAVRAAVAEWEAKEAEANPEKIERKSSVRFFPPSEPKPQPLGKGHSSGRRPYRNSKAATFVAK